MDPTAAAPEDEVTAQARELTEILQGGGVLGDIFEYEDAEYEAVYALSFDLYRQGRYSDALKGFAFLVMVNHMDRRFHLGLASCSQMLQRYEQAVQHYTLASVMDMTDPLPTFHTAECLMALGMVAEAVEALTVVVEQSQTEARAEVRGRAEALLALVQPLDPVSASA